MSQFETHFDTLLEGNMKTIKEKSKGTKAKDGKGRSSTRSQPAISSKQAAKLLKDKYVRQLEQRQPDSAEVQAVDQVEQAGSWAVDELLTHGRPPSPQQKETQIKEQPREDIPHGAEQPASAVSTPEVHRPTPQERAVAAHERSARAPKERVTAFREPSAQLSPREVPGVRESPVPPLQEQVPDIREFPASSPQEQAASVQELPVPTSQKRPSGIRDSPASPLKGKKPASTRKPSAPRTKKQALRTRESSPRPSQAQTGGREAAPLPAQRRAIISQNHPAHAEDMHISLAEEVHQNQPDPPAVIPSSAPVKNPPQRTMRIKERPTAKIKEQKPQAAAPIIKKRDSSLNDPSIPSIKSIESTPSPERHLAPPAVDRSQEPVIARPGGKLPFSRQRTENTVQPPGRTDARASCAPLPSSGSLQFKREAHRQALTAPKRNLPHQSGSTVTQKTANPISPARSTGAQSAPLVRTRAATNVKSGAVKLRSGIYQKGISGPKVARSPVRAAITRPVQGIRQTCQQRMNWQAVQKAGKAAGTTAAAFKRTAVVVTKVAASLVNTLAAIAGGGVLLLAMVTIIVIAAVANSPFGLFFAQEPNAPGTVSVAQAVGTVNAAYNSRLELLQAGDYDAIDVQGQAPDWAEVLAVFAVKTAGADVGGLDVATLDTDRVDKLTAVFWDMTEITVTEETIEHADSNPDDDVDDSWTEKLLHITITPKTADDMRINYSFTDYQNDALDELLSDRAALSSMAGSLAITSADVRDVLAALPAGLEQARQDTVQTALQLVGKVNYFWGGKSSAIGWDSRWGTLQKVTAAGSPSTGTYRPFGLDCSGMIDWVLRNCGLHSDGNWYVGTNLMSVSQADAQPGDFALYPDASHIGIIVGRNEAGKLLVCHCSSGRNNVVVTEFSASGFTVVGRPDIFTP